MNGTPEPSATDHDRVWTEQRIRALGAITDIPTAGRIFGLGRARAYELARLGQFPVPVIAVGSRSKVATAAILTALGLSTGLNTGTGTGTGDLTDPPTRSVDQPGRIRTPDAQQTEPDQGAP